MKGRKWCLILLTLIFILLVVLIKMDAITGFDDCFYNLITTTMNPTLNTFYKCITFFGSTLFIIAIAVVLFITFLLLKKKNIAYIEASVIIISTIINNLIKIIIRRSRPTVLALVHETTFSFPSGHTMAAVSMYGILLYFVLKSNWSKKIKIVLSLVLGLLPIMVAISRVYLGAHYMSDVCGAFILSVILLLIETYYIDKKKWI